MGTDDLSSPGAQNPKSSSSPSCREHSTQAVAARHPIGRGPESFQTRELTPIQIQIQILFNTVLTGQ